MQPKVVDILVASDKTSSVLDEVFPYGSAGSLASCLHLSELTLQEQREMRVNAETRISTLLAKLDVLHILRTTVEEKLRCARKDLAEISAACDERPVRPSPINRLPPEILLRILHLLLAPYTRSPSRHRHRPDLVCHRWRDALLSDGQFWSHFSWLDDRFSTKANCTRLQLRRSATAPLSFNLEQTMPGFSPGDLDLVSRIAPRLKTLRICHAFDSDLALTQPIFSCFSTIQELFLPDHNLGCPPTAEIVVKTNPALRKAEVSSEFFDSYPSLFQNVEELAITLAGDDFRTPHRIIALASLPELASLELRGRYEKDPTCSGGWVSRAELPGLSTLRLNVYSGRDSESKDDLLQLIKGLHAPHLTSFLWKPYDDDPEHDRYTVAQPGASESKVMTAVIQIVAGKWPQLTTLGLFLDSNFRRSFNLSAVFRALRNLKNIKLVHSVESDSRNIRAHFVEGIQALGKPSDGQPWICPTLQSLTILLLVIPRFDLGILLDVARDRAFSNEVPALRRICIHSKYLQWKGAERARLGLYVSEIFEEQVDRRGAMKLEA